MQAAFLKPGDKIGITCPAGAVKLSEMEAMFQQLKRWGFEIEVGKTVGSSYFKFSATDEQRKIELQQMLDDDSIKAILFARGGYGSVRILDELNFEKFCQKPKWLLGYSDITVFHSHLNTNFNIATIHSHMGSGYLPEKLDEESTQSIFNMLTGIPSIYKIKSHSMNRLGQAKGKLCGGNLAILSDLTGTPSDIQTEGTILFFEDVSEYRYNIDRMLWQLLRAGKLDKLAGLIVGSFTDTQDNEIPFGLTENEIVWEKVKSYNYPVCFDFPVGHQSRNLALKTGAEYELNVSKKEVTLNELTNLSF